MSEKQREYYIQSLEEVLESEWTKIRHEACFTEGAIEDLLELLKEKPKRKTGKWIWEGEKPWERCRCSECGYYRQLKIPEPDCFCPNCGSYNGDCLNHGKEIQNDRSRKDKCVG